MQSGRILSALLLCLPNFGTGISSKRETWAKNKNMSQQCEGNSDYKCYISTKRFA